MLLWWRPNYSCPAVQRLPAASVYCPCCMRWCRYTWAGLLISRYYLIMFLLWLPLLLYLCLEWLVYIYYNICCSLYSRMFTRRQALNNNFKSWVKWQYNALRTLLSQMVLRKYFTMNNLSSRQMLCSQLVHEQIMKLLIIQNYTFFFFPANGPLPLVHYQFLPIIVIRTFFSTGRFIKCYLLFLFSFSWVMYYCLEIHGVENLFTWHGQLTDGLDGYD